MKTNVTKFAVGIVLLVVLPVGGVLLGSIVWRVHRSVQEYSGMAQQAHPHADDDVASLVDFMNSGAHSFQDRNHAVWSLGHLGDVKALPALETMYTGKPCNHAAALCQYELEKAIKLCGGTPNPPRTTRH